MTSIGDPQNSMAGAPRLQHFQGLASLDKLAELPPGSVVRIDVVAAELPALQKLGASMGTAGLHIELTEHEGTWSLLACSAEPDDLRDLEAPEPMQEVLEVCAELEGGDSYLARTPCPARPLKQRLIERGLWAWLHEDPDGSGLVFVWKPPA